MTALAVTGLTVTFGGVRAVDDVSFAVAPGQILGLIGPNGAGKTTVLDAVCGLVASGGSVRLGAADISGMAPAARARAGLGRSFQDAKLFPSLTVYENLCLGCERHIRAEGVVSTALSLPWVRRTERRVSRRADELVDQMRLGAFRDKFVSELSTGSRRIVDLAVILAHEPSVLLLDEPSSGIAQRETEALAPLLLRLRQETGAAMLVIEHDMPLVSGIADELLALETGQVLTQGRPADVLADPRLVSAYLGSNQAVIARSGRAVHGDDQSNPVEAASERSGDQGGRASARTAQATRGARTARSAPRTRSTRAASATRTARETPDEATASTEPRAEPRAAVAGGRAGPTARAKAAPASSRRAGATSKTTRRSSRASGDGDTSEGAGPRAEAEPVAEGPEGPAGGNGPARIDGPSRTTRRRAQEG